jgi:hypothetical protein
MSSDDYEELGLKTCRNSFRNGWHRFCEAVKVDMTNSKEKSFNHTISSTLSLITVSCEDFFDAINIHKALIDCNNSHIPQPSVTE